MATFWRLEREVQGQNGTKFFSYDTGYEGEGRTKQLLYYAAHMNMEPWQISYVGETAAHIYQNTFNPMVKEFCKEVIVDITDWVVKTDDIPMGDLLKEKDKEFTVTFLVGGNMTEIYPRPNAPRLDPHSALNLPEDVQFYPLSMLRAHYWDGKYWTPTLPNNKPRVHYPKNQIGPHATHATIYNWANLMLARFLVTGKREDILWALWVYRDSKYFANRSSTKDMRTLGNPDKIHYNTGNIGRTRAFSWWANGSHWAREALEHFDRQINKAGKESNPDDISDNE